LPALRGLSTKPPERNASISVDNSFKKSNNVNKDNYSMHSDPTIRNRGFTIVELLIVIVVIGILAAITIVAYNGVQSRARATQYQSDAGTIDSKAESYGSINSTYALTAAGTDLATVTAQTTAGAALTTSLNGLNESKLPANIAIFAVVPIGTVPTNAQATTAINALSTVNQYFVAYCATGKGMRVYYPDPTAATTASAKFTDVGICP
jgi:prepilin-type N-terminal cleavage/methylation domain-containing protein